MLNNLNDLNNIVPGWLLELQPQWWLEIITKEPECTYYFGPFHNPAEAGEARFGYIEDLEGEGAKDIEVIIKRCQPEVLTMFDESNHDS